MLSAPLLFLTYDGGYEVSKDIFTNGYNILSIWECDFFEIVHIKPSEAGGHTGNRNIEWKYLDSNRVSDD